jgi:hypothetical protein
MRMTSSVATSDEKKTEEGIVMSPLEPESNPPAVADPPEARALTPAATERASDILTNCKIMFWGSTQNLGVVNGRTKYRSLLVGNASSPVISSSLDAEAFLVAMSCVSFSPSVAVGRLV